MGDFDDVVAANADYQREHVDRGLPGRAARGLAVVTCMDSRIDPLRVLGLQPGDAKILRTAGARITDDMLRGLVLAQHLLGVDRVLVLAHTDCAMARTREDDVHGVVRERTGVDSRSLVFHTFEDQQATLERDVQRIRSLPYLTGDLTVAGGVYDLRTGAITLTVT